MEVQLGSFLSEVNEKTTTNNQYPVLTSSKSGLYLQSEYFNKQVASKDNTGYKIIKRNQFTYRAMSDTGEFFPNILDCADVGIVSPAYPVFEISDKSVIIPEYLKYFFKSNSFQHSISSFAQGSTRTSVKFNKMRTITINIPSIEKQKETVEIIKKISAIITHRRTQLEKLDLLVKARFVEMFGTYPTNEYDWEIGTIRDLVTEVRYGSSRKASDNNSGKYPYLRMNNITYSGELDLSDTKTIDIPDKELPKCTVRKGDVLFNRTNSKELVGKTCVYNRDEKMVLAGFIIRIRLNEKMLPDVLSSFLNTDFSKKMLLEMCKTAIGQANINAQEMQNIGIYIPPIELQEKFVTFKRQVDKSKATIQKALDEAQLLFDSLMQEYFG
ncbi:MAG: restriction endonuclease subunit S [Ruminococcus callidus]|uniref:restriction endonuclease subunit S n=1 Tax=Ruminococcus callidus TaxID=40519 RepID=UPI002E773F47|nr:restriction endonuclease subunit S [Ruminococcus callidus]MEE0504969.1 restriction endonuclease subunit S [Ruminococcus callidus]